MPDEKQQMPKITWSLFFVIMLADAIGLVLFFGLLWYFFKPDPPKVEDVAAVLNAQVAAWNRGDLEGYMAGYWNDPELHFYSGGEITKGWQPTLDRYRRRYQSEGKEMGQLTFPYRAVQIVSKDAAMVRGRWHLDYKTGKSDEGLFTLSLYRINNEWKIVHDHSSIASPSEKP